MSEALSAGVCCGVYHYILIRNTQQSHWWHVWCGVSVYSLQDRGSAEVLLSMMIPVIHKSGSTYSGVSENNVPMGMSTVLLAMRASTLRITSYTLHDRRL